MNYTIIWEPPAENDLAAVWVRAADRNAVTAAAHRLDQDLARDPYGRGFPVGSPQTRTAAEWPLGIDYDIVEDDKLVRIVRVWSLV